MRFPSGLAQDKIAGLVRASPTQHDRTLATRRARGPLRALHHFYGGRSSSTTALMIRDSRLHPSVVQSISSFWGFDGQQLIGARPSLIRLRVWRVPAPLIEEPKEPLRRSRFTRQGPLSWTGARTSRPPDVLIVRALSSQTLSGSAARSGLLGRSCESGPSLGKRPVDSATTP